jgi:hypothetical protein
MHSQLQSLIPEELAQKYATAEPQAAGENRPITALFADISGFTPLSSTQSSETMLQLVQDCFKELVGIVARYEGIISGFRGDGLLALFGAPILHELVVSRIIHIYIGHNPELQASQIPVYITLRVEIEPGAIHDLQAAAGRYTMKIPPVIHDFCRILNWIGIAHRYFRFHILKVMQESDLVRLDRKSGYGKQQKAY